jgi:Tat protein translocase TatB subunit
MLNIGPQELILVLIIALVVVGPKRLPELGRTIGRGMREFRKMQDDVRDTLKIDLDPDPEPPKKPVAKPHMARNTEPDDPDEVIEAPADVVADRSDPSPDETSPTPEQAPERPATADVEPEAAE